MQQDVCAQEEPKILEVPARSKSQLAGEGTISPERIQREGGYLLLSILLLVAFMVIAATIEAPALVQQAKRDREEEMIHRGTEYARAIKKYYKKFGRYPANLEQLDNTNQIRFLRRRFKDPLTKEGDWKMLHYGDIAAIAGATTLGSFANQPGGLGGQPGGLGGQPGGALGSTLGGIGPSNGIGGNQNAGTAPAG